MEEIVKEKKELCESIKNQINDFIKKYNLDFNSLTYEIDWTEKPYVLKELNVKVIL